MELGGEGHRDEGKCRGEARRPSKSPEVGPGPPTPQGHGQGEKPRKKRKAYGDMRAAQRRQRTSETRAAGGHRESPQEDGERPMGTESTPWTWGVVCGDRRRPGAGGKAHRNGNKDAHHRDREAGRAKWEKVTEMGKGGHRYQEPIDTRVCGHDRSPKVRAAKPRRQGRSPQK